MYRFILRSSTPGITRSIAKAILETLEDLRVFLSRNYLRQNSAGWQLKES